MWSKGKGTVCFLLAAAAAVFPVSLQAADEEECLRCHGLPGITVTDEGEPRRLTVPPLESSVHNLLNCRECHSDIAAIPHPEATGDVTCGQACHQRDQSGDNVSHESLFWEYTTSVHGQDKERRVSCMTCHPSASLAIVEATRRDLLDEADQCASCHARSGHVRKYFSDIHYLALLRGSRRAPSCPDCHTAHRVLPPDDAESSVHQARLAATCSGGLPGIQEGRCHPTLSDETLQGGTMAPLPLPGDASGAIGWIFNTLYWALLAGLGLRALYGALRGR